MLKFLKVATSLCSFRRKCLSDRALETYHLSPILAIIKSVSLKIKKAGDSRCTSKHRTGRSLGPGPSCPPDALLRFLIATWNRMCRQRQRLQKLIRRLQACLGRPEEESALCLLCDTEERHVPSAAGRCLIPAEMPPFRPSARPQHGDDGT